MQFVDATAYRFACSRYCMSCAIALVWRQSIGTDLLAFLSHRNINGRIQEYRV